MHWQNLNEKYNPDGTMTEGPAWRHGRAWFGPLRIEWVIPDFALSLHFEVDPDEGEIRLGFGLLFLSLYFGVGSVPRWIFDWTLPKKACVASWEDPPRTFYLHEPRQIWLHWYNWSFSWHFWDHPNEWNCKNSKWRVGWFDVKDFVLGQMDHNFEILSKPKSILVPMPEGCYPGKLHIERRTWTRRRWPWMPCKIVRVSRCIEMEGCIPFSGKGTTSYNCGEDGICATGFDVDSDEKAICLFAASALETRRKRGDDFGYRKNVVMAQAEDSGGETR